MVWTHGRTLRRWRMGDCGLEGEGASGAGPARRAAGLGRGVMFPYSQRAKRWRFLFGWFYLVLSSFSFTLDPLLFFQKGKLRQRTSWLAISVEGGKVVERKALQICSQKTSVQDLL